jgi:hypothetical protein
MKADVDRTMPSPGVLPEAAGPNVDEMRRMLFRDLLAQLRVEFERGA